MALDPAYFTLLGIYNGGWTDLANYSSLSALVNGTGGNDRIDMTGGLFNLNLTVNGLAGNDRIDSSNVGLANTLFGAAGEDQIYGGAGVNTIVGGDGDDYIDGGHGIDILDARNAGGGDNGNDTVSYESLSAGLGVTLTLNASGGGAARSGLNGDTLLGGFENVVGSAYNDTVTGNALNNILVGLAGNDTLNGGDGNDTLVGGIGGDTLNGGDGIDTADYSTSSAGVHVSLTGGTGPLGDAAGDTLISIENLTGSAFDDFLQGDGGDNGIQGGAGSDHLHGDAGNDTFVYKSFSDLFGPGAGIDRWDLIQDFAPGDKIDLSALDANVIAPGNQAFTFNAAGFTGVAGQLAMLNEGPDVAVGLDIDGDRYANYVIFFSRDSGVAENVTDYIL